MWRTQCLLSGMKGALVIVALPMRKREAKRHTLQCMSDATESFSCLLHVMRFRMVYSNGDSDVAPNSKEATKQGATKQRSKDVTRQRSNDEGTKQQSNEAAKQRSNKSTKQWSTEATNSRRNEKRRERITKQRTLQAARRL